LHFGSTDIVGPLTAGLMRSTERWSSSPISGNLLSYSAEAFVFLDNAEWSGLNAVPTVGSGGYEVLLHEIGHALGLGHPFDGVFRLPAGDDNTDNTVMSYTTSGSAKSTFQAYDLLALQWIYGGDGLGGTFGLNSTNGPSVGGTAVATFAVAASIGSVREGAAILFTLSTTNVADGTVVPFSIVGAIDAVDLLGGRSTGSFTVVGNRATVAITPINDAATEGPEVLSLSLDGRSGTATVWVADSSIAIGTKGSAVGTLTNDVLVVSGGNSYRGGAGSDVYVISPVLLAAPVIAEITDTEGSNTVQLVDGTVIASSRFLSDAVELTLDTGARVQVLGASRYVYQVGADAVGGDFSSPLSFSQFAEALGASVPAGGGSTSGVRGFVVPTSFTRAAPPPPTSPGAASVVGTLGPDYLVVSAGHTYRGGASSDTYVVGGNTFAGAVTAIVSDTEGLNVVQLVDGTVLSSSLFLNDAVQLTLSTGARVQVLGASRLLFQLGANTLEGDAAALLGYAAFSSALGASVPPVGGAGVNGIPNYLVPGAGLGLNLPPLEAATPTELVGVASP
jgi:hypothetical protein